jgi:cellulose synthase/poly-beta-1,6-N-acetylglucosamine synthase-like glycosyltransferase
VQNCQDIMFVHTITIRAGTNFAVRARELSRVGWFPTFTITEDYALGMLLCAAGVRGRYLPLHLAVSQEGLPAKLHQIMGTP